VKFSDGIKEEMKYMIFSVLNLKWPDLHFQFKKESQQMISEYIKQLL